jgi:hypothetical protein
MWKACVLRATQGGAQANLVDQIEILSTRFRITFFERHGT